VKKLILLILSGVLFLIANVGLDRKRKIIFSKFFGAKDSLALEQRYTSGWCNRSEVESCIYGHEDFALSFVPSRVSILVPCGALFGEPGKGLFVPPPDLGIRRGGVLHLPPLGRC
jgi:hypothetical protein